MVVHPTYNESEVTAVIRSQKHDDAVHVCPIGQRRLPQRVLCHEPVEDLDVESVGATADLSPHQHCADPFAPRLPRHAWQVEVVRSEAPGHIGWAWRT